MSVKKNISFPALQQAYAELAGTASLAIRALTSDSASFVESASFAQTASFLLGSIESASFAQTASYVQTAQTASYVLNAVSASYSITSSYAENSSNGVPYKSYVALISQTGSNNPTATVLYNSLDSGILLTYIDTGSYSIDSPSSSFTDGKTYISITNSDPSYFIDNFIGAPFASIYPSSSNFIIIKTFLVGSGVNYANDILYSSSVEIRVYP